MDPKLDRDFDNRKRPLDRSALFRSDRNFNFFADRRQGCVRFRRTQVSFDLHEPNAWSDAIELRFASNPRACMRGGASCAAISSSAWTSAEELDIELSVDLTWEMQGHRQLSRGAKSTRSEGEY